MRTARTLERRVLRLGGAVQGVGFRPFVYRLARRLGLSGRVRNEAGWVSVDAEGPPERLDELERRLVDEAPPPAWPETIESTKRPSRGYRTFAIAASLGTTRPGTSPGLVPDQATCARCREEVLAPEGRRAGYAFTSCSSCGPRYTISETLAYDRDRTSMGVFTMCDWCRREYDDPGDRRFHTQANACPTCGPRVRWLDASGREVPSDPVSEAVRAIRGGGVVAVQGLGGFHLLADARSQAAVTRVRRFKRRDAKPLAVMYPSLVTIEEDCLVSPTEARLLQHTAAPITLLTARSDCSLAPAVGGDMSRVGAFLPYTPLHALVLQGVGHPVVATSGNHGDEPTVTEVDDARRVFAGAVDGLVVHDRRIARRCDDSVAQVVGGAPSVLRRARGYVPAPIRLSGPCRPTLALGGHLKATVAVAAGAHVTLSPHIGDLDAASVRPAYLQEIERLLSVHRVVPEVVACDLHPDYFSTRQASSFGGRVVAVQHHEAHVAACAAEHGLRGPYLGVAWDGTGYGRDATIWGSEFFVVEGDRFHRVAHLRPYRLPGGEAAARDGRRSGWGLLMQLPDRTTPPELKVSEVERSVFSRQVEQGLNAPWTTSAGRLFDAVAALCGVRRRSAYEGHAAARLEQVSAMERVTDHDRYPMPVAERARLELDWRPLVEAIVRDIGAGVPPAVVGARFHATLSEAIVAVARRFGLTDVVLSGGVFQNALLTERTMTGLERAGFHPRVHRAVPPNDGGLALGQAVVAGQEH